MANTLVLNSENLGLYAPNGEHHDLSVFTSIKVECMEIPAFYFKERLDGQYITIDDELEHIGDSAFEGCEFTLVSNQSNPRLNYIGNRAFKGCTPHGDALSIGYRQSSSIGIEAFMECSSWMIYAGSMLHHIGNWAFKDSDILVDLYGVAIQSIGEEAFQRNSEILSLHCESNITIGRGAFSECKNLTNVYLPNATRIDEEAFQGCEKLSTVCLGYKLKKIEDRTFMSCRRLSYIYIPYSVSRIGDWSFAYCGVANGYFIIHVGSHRGVPYLSKSALMILDGQERYAYVVIPDKDEYSDWYNGWHGSYYEEMQHIEFMWMREGVHNENIEECTLNPTILFNVNDITFVAEKGMTWEEWVASNYSEVYVDPNALSSIAYSNRIIIDNRESTIVKFGGPAINWPCHNDVKTIVYAHDRSRRVHPSDKIVENGTYSVNYSTYNVAGA